MAHFYISASTRRIQIISWILLHKEPLSSLIKLEIDDLPSAERQHAQLLSKYYVSICFCLHWPVFIFAPLKGLCCAKQFTLLVFDPISPDPWCSGVSLSFAVTHSLPSPTLFFPTYLPSPHLYHFLCLVLAVKCHTYAQAQDGLQEHTYPGLFLNPSLILFSPALATLPHVDLLYTS